MKNTCENFVFCVCFCCSPFSSCLCKNCTLFTQCTSCLYSQMLFIQFKEGNAKDFIDAGTVPLRVSGSCQIIDIKSNTSYTVRIRYARLYKNRYYFGEYNTANIYSTIGGPPPTGMHKKVF